MDEVTSGSVGVTEWLEATKGIVVYGYVPAMTTSESVPSSIEVTTETPSEELRLFKSLTQGLLQVSKDEISR